MTSTNPLAAKYEIEINEFKVLEKEFSKLATTRNQYATQLNENEMVFRELDLSAEDAEIHKLIGPALVKQSREEALSNVKKRIDFINGEIKRLDNSVKDLQKKIELKKQRVTELQSALQRQQLQQQQTQGQQQKK